ncbi:hypothetical protein Belba_1567 [Belliella baltica DSM 15883]|uniref:Uncharacterized protein n=1 Tax=Belliella baltica (strain DSM 15883 / CIP 108006 / LMG 21964 / BA134) TaxID=866536 RepID=I3Z4K9_BELBD|nr:hypothetical protein Belba_1567 [Belliella baltica DSM 15883]
MKYHITFIVLILCLSLAKAQEIPSKEIQIKTALLAAPEEMKAGAMVYGYDEKGEFIILRKGTNELICLADDPKSPGFNASCYFKVHIAVKVTPYQRCKVTPRS